MLSAAAAALLAGVAVSGAALAQTAPAAAPAAPAGPMPMPMSTPSMTAPLSANPAPLGVDAGPLGKVYVTGALTGIGLTQNNAVPGDQGSWGDLSNAQIFVQKVDGPLQFFIQAGVYATPSLGASYVRASTLTNSTYNIIPQAFVKFVPNSSFNIMVGKLPTLVGAEYTFSFENINIERGLLWNQEPAVSRGVQANYTSGPITLSVSWNDGYYSNRYTWGSALLTYAFDPNNSLTLVGAANFDHNGVSAFATPLAQDNGQIYNVIYSHTSGNLTLTPYFQYEHVPATPKYGITADGSTTAVALLGKYNFTPEISLGGRAEYISSAGGTSMLYGPGSSAWSITLTPTYQKGIYFLRGEFSYTEADSAAKGSAFGPTGLASSQTRGVIESGVLF